MEVGFVRAVGVRTRFLSVGSGSPVVMLHGFHGSADHYRWLAPKLASDHTTYALDLLGHGETEWAIREYRLGDYGRHLVAVLDALDIGRTALVGNSLGGAVAMWVAINAPERIDRLALLCPAGLAATTRLGAAQFGLGYAEVVAGVRPGVAASLSRRIQFADPRTVDPAFFERKAADARLRRRGHHRRVTLAQSHGLAHLDPVEPRLIPHRTLIVWGDRDRALSWRRARFRIERFPDARLEVIPDAGHLPHVETPDAVASLLLPFLRKGTG